MQTQEFIIRITVSSESKKRIIISLATVVAAFHGQII